MEDPKTLAEDIVYAAVTQYPSIEPVRALEMATEEVIRNRAAATRAWVKREHGRLLADVTRKQTEVGQRLGARTGQPPVPPRS